MNEMPKIVVEMEFLARADGGREQTPNLSDPTRYRPHLTVADGDYLGVCFLSAPASVQAGTPFIAVLGLVYHTGADYSALVPGIEFTVREGLRTVGRGRVIDRSEAGTMEQTPAILGSNQEDMLLTALQAMRERYPEWRFGQLVSNLATWARGPTASAVWEVEDAELVQAAQRHLERLKRDTG